MWILTLDDAMKSQFRTGAEYQDFYIPASGRSSCAVTETDEIGTGKVRYFLWFEKTEANPKNIIPAHQSRHNTKTHDDF